MESQKKLTHFIKGANGFSFWLLFFVIFLGIFWPLHQGAGNNWDWLFPYFSDSYKSIVQNQLSSWSTASLGAPLGYNSGIFVMLFYALFLFLKVPSEIFLYLFLAGLLATGCYIIFCYCRDKGILWASLIALAVFINPVVFYKLLAGHVLYLVGYVAFIGLIVFLLKKYQPHFRSALIVGLLIALSGTQIQYFIFSGIALIAYYLFYRQNFRFRDLVIIILVTILVHLSWLITIFTGANSIASLAETAQASAFSDLSHTALKDILLFDFSPATFIRYFYTKSFLAYFALLYLFIIIAAISSKLKSKESWFFLSLFLVFVFITTGIYQNWPVPIIDKLYPMFREAGHAAVPLVLFLLLFLHSIYNSDPSRRTNRYFSYSLKAYLFIFIIINAVFYFVYVPRVNYSLARNYFSQFDNFSQQDDSAYRILTYPFFSQYSLSFEPTLIKRGSPVSNSGWDSFTLFLNRDAISNNVPPYSFQQSLQYQFLQSYNVDLLAQQNIKYIYDYSAVYSSNYDKFVNSNVYNNNLSVIKNNPQFLQKIIAANPGKVKMVAPHVLEITDYQPRLAGNGLSFTYLSPTQYQLTLSHIKGSDVLHFLDSFHSGWQLYPGSSTITCTNALKDECSNKVSDIVGNELGFLTKAPISNTNHIGDSKIGQDWTISPQQYQNVNWITKNTDGTYNVNLTLFYRPQAYYLLGLGISIIAIIATAVFLILPVLTRKRKVTANR